jgi:putative MATE family efflux protein
MVSQTDAAAAPKSLPKQMLIFALPIMAMNILQLLFNAADMVVVGRFSGSEALAAVGATGALINLIVNLFMGLSVGTTVVLANDYGAQRYDDIKLTVHTSMAVSMISGLIVMGIGLAFCVPLLRMMGTPEDIITGSALYMRIFFLGLPGSMVYNFGAAVMRAVGDSRRPTYFLTIAGVANVILNLFFVAGLRMGVAGVAWATVISQYAAMGLTLLSLIRRDGPIRFIPRLMTIDRRKLLGIVRIGLPAGLQGVLFSISNVLIQSAVNSFGSVVVAASAAAGNVEGFVATTSNAFYNAALTFTGQRMGAEDYDGIDTIAKVCTAYVFLNWLVVGGATIYFGPTLLGFYTTNPEVIAVGMERMRVLMAVYFTCGTMNVFPGITRAMGYSVLPMLCTLVGACLMRIVWLVTFFAWMPTITMLFLCYPVTWTLAGLGQVAVFFYARKQVRKRAAAVSGITPAAPAAVR